MRTWSKLSGPGNVTFGANGTAAANNSSATFDALGSYSLRVTVSNGSSIAIGDVTVTVDSAGNQPPTVATAANASPNPVTGTTTNLSVLGADDGGESNLTYTWSATFVPSGASAPIFSINGTNAAKNTTATFSKMGAYTLMCTMKDVGGLTVTSSVNVTVNATLTTIVVTPTSAVVLSGQSQNFVATAQDQFSNPMAASLTWSASGGGTIDANGIFSATIVGGPFTVKVVSGAINATASVTVSAVPVSPAITQQPADQTVTEGQSATFTVQATGTGVLSYQWRKNGTDISPPATAVNYTTPATTLADSGEKFSVVVTNNQGSVTSIDALLTVVPMSTPNKPPTVNAGGYQAVSLLTGADLNGIISDDGFTQPAWRCDGDMDPNVSGPGVTTFENPNLATTHATFSIDGVYVLRLTAFDGELSSSDNAQIVVMPVVSDKAPSSSITIENNVWVAGKSVGWIRFLNLLNAHVIIRARNGSKIHEWFDVSGTLEWHATDQEGRDVPSGIYQAQIQSSEGQSKYKLAVVH